MALAAYLAKNYLNASGASSDPSDLSARPKKRRKKDKSRAEETSLIIADDDELSLRNSSVAGGEDDPDRPLFDTNTRSAEFRKSKKNNWMSLTSSTTPTPDADQAAADRILAAAAADLDKSREGVNQEDAPAIVATEHDKDVTQMSSGIRAGLQTAADTAALEAAEAQRKEAERRTLKSQRRTKVHDEPEEETVYRDATGRRIDVSMKRAEARAAELARLKAEKAEKESAMGDVQRQAKAERKAELEEAKFMPVARGEDDEDMNDELRGRVRWDDPMAGYMAQKQAEEAPARVKGHGQEQGFVKVRRKEYPGAAPPNRYGIKPGWRWDGVDRGNGFEKEWFQARGRKARNENLEYQWQMDE